MAEDHDKQRKHHLETLLGECRARVKELEKDKKRRLHPFASYLLRTIGIVSILGGGAGDMAGISFPFWAGAISGGLILLIIDPWIEPTLKSLDKSWKVAPSLVFLVTLFSFLHWIVFLPSPLNVIARDNNEDYPRNTTSLFGIEWNEEYSDLRVVFENPTDYAYKNLDFNIEPTGLFVAGQSQTSNLSGVQLFNTMKGQDVLTAKTPPDKNGKTSYIDQKDVKLEAGTIRMLCDTLPKHSMFEIILALHAIPEGILPGVDRPKLPLFTLRQPAKVVRVYGSYESRGGRNRAIEIKVPVTLN